MKVYHIFFTIFLIVSCRHENSNTIAPAQKIKKATKIISKEKEYQPYELDTILSDGYHLSYNLNLEKEKTHSLTLMKDEYKIRELSKDKARSRHDNLGYIGADLGNYFIFSHSPGGSGNPTDIEIIEKKNGKVITKGTWVDVDTTEFVVLYIINLHEKNEELKLFDLKNQKERTISDFDNCQCVQHAISGMRVCVDIQSVNKKEVTLNVEYEEEKIVKRYSR